MDFDPLSQHSLPLTKKRLAPAVSCVAFFYSDEAEHVFHAFATDDLRASLNSRSQYQAAALMQDPSARVGWVLCADKTSKQKLLNNLREQTALSHPARESVAA